MRICLFGKIDRIFCCFGVEKYRYANPVIAANDDCIEFRTIEYVNLSVGGSCSVGVGGRILYFVIVIAS